MALCDFHSEDEYNKATQTHKDSLMYSNPEDVHTLLAPDVRTHTSTNSGFKGYDQFNLPDFKAQSMETKYVDLIFRRPEMESKFYRQGSYPISLPGRNLNHAYIGLHGYPDLDVDSSSFGSPRSPPKPQPEPTILQLKREAEYQQDMMNQVRNRIREVENLKYPHAHDENFMPHNQNRDWGGNKDFENSSCTCCNEHIANHKPHRCDTQCSFANEDRDIGNQHSPGVIAHRLPPLNYVELNKRDFRKANLVPSTYSGILKDRKERIQHESPNRSIKTRNTSLSPLRNDLNSSKSRSHEDLWNQHSHTLGASRDLKLEPFKDDVKSKVSLGKYPVLGNVHVSGPSKTDTGDNQKISIDINLNVANLQDHGVRSQMGNEKKGGSSHFDIGNSTRISPRSSNSTCSYSLHGLEVVIILAI